MKLEGGCCEGLWREPRHRAALSYHLWLAELAWAEASSRKPSLMDPELLRAAPSLHQTCGPVQVEPQGCPAELLLFPPGSGGLDCQPWRPLGLSRAEEAGGDMRVCVSECG